MHRTLTRGRIAIAGLAAAGLLCGTTAATAGTISAQGAVTALTNRNQIVNGSEGLFDEGPVNTNIPLGIYSSLGITFHSGAFSGILPGIVSAGTASNPGYRSYSNFPNPAGGGLASGFQCRVCGVATFGHVVTQVGLTASTNGTQYLTAWDTSGQLIGQVTWAPANDSSFVGIDTNGVAIGMVSYGNDDMFNGATYSIGGATIQSDTWVWTAATTCLINGVHEAGEQCDDGNVIAGDGCSPNCLLEYCGNGITEPGELCDDGNQMSGDNCSADCLSNESCGNGIVDIATGEGCDDGNNIDGDGCQSNCMLATCGDGVLDAGESCDDGNNNDNDGCNATCTSDETCSNGVIDVGETCDDGNTAGGDGCSATCLVEYCGNGEVDLMEVCDDGNNTDGDGCAGNCGSDESCGNGIIDAVAGEACDDGNNNEGDGCQANCALPACGDGIVDMGETCDDSNSMDGDGCNATCTSDETCGNNIVDSAVGEACDDGGVIDGDGCSATCALQSCGDGVVDANETCDDGNTTNGDGCNATCTSDETCGNGVVDAGEFCDQGSNNSSDGPCSASCEAVTPPTVVDEGCGCRIAGDHRREGSGLALLMVGAALAFRRRRQR